MFDETQQVRKDASTEEKLAERQDERMRLAEEKLAERAGKSTNRAVMGDKYWEEYAERTDPFSKKVLAVHHMLSSNKFDAAIGVVILMNSVMIGVQSEYDLSGKDLSAFIIIDNIFLGVYTVELGCRFFAYGKHCLENGWVRFDAALVGLGLGSSILEHGLAQS